LLVNQILTSSSTKKSILHDCFIVENFKYPLLLGLDALEKFNAKVDFGKRKLTIPGCHPIPFYNSRAEENAVIKPDEEIFLQPRSGMIKIVPPPIVQESSSEIATPLETDTVLETFDMEEFAQDQLQDSYFGPIINYIRNKTLPNKEEDAKRIILEASHFDIVDGLLYRFYSPPAHQRPQLYPQLALPYGYRAHVLESLHKDPLSGHLGFAKTFSKIQKRFFWPHYAADTRHWIASCNACVTKKTPRSPQAGLLQPIVTTRPFEILAVDITGPFPTTRNGNRYIVVFGDHFTKWMEAFPLPSVKASDIIKLLVTEIIPRHGLPQQLLSDRGSQFVSQLVSALCKELGITKLNTSAYHPQCDGLVERFNHTLIEMLSHYVDEHQSDWDSFIPFCLFAYRTAKHESTQESPFFLLYGREPILPIDFTLGTSPTTTNGPDSKEQLLDNINEAQQVAQTYLERQRQRQIEYYNDRRREVSYEPGQKVWLYTPNLKKGLSKKLLHPWHGPYTIDSQLSPVNYRLKDTNNRRFNQIVHVARLKPFVDPLHRPEQSVDLPETDQFDLDQESLDISGRAEFPGRHLSPGRVMLPDDLPTDPLLHLLAPQVHLLALQFRLLVHLVTQLRLLVT